MRIEQYKNINNIMQELKAHRRRGDGLGAIIFDGIIRLILGGFLLLMVGGIIFNAPSIEQPIFILFLGGIFSLIAFLMMRPVYDSYKYFNYCKMSVENLPDGVLSIIDKQCQNAVQLGSGAVTQDAVLSYTPYGPLILLNRDIVWIYILNTTYRYGGINTGNTNRIICCTSDGKRHTITTVSGEYQNAARTFFNDAFRLLNYGGYSDIAFGYTRERDKLFRKDPAGFKYAVRSYSGR